MSNESLSALLDGEVSSAELDRLLDQMGSSPELSARWSRLCRNRDAQEGTRILKSQPCICAGVMAQLQGSSPEAAGASDKVVDLASRRRLPRVWKPLIGFAAAAGVAAVAVMAVRPVAGPGSGLESPGLSSGLPTFNVSSRIEIPTLGRPSSGGLLSVSMDPEIVQSWPKSDEESAQQLRDFLMDHSNSVGGVGGTLRYARFAAHTAEYRPQEGQP